MESRQVQRAEIRRQLKLMFQERKKEAFNIQSRSLRQRQLRREKEGSYSGLSTVACMAGSKSRIGERQVMKGQYEGRILFETERGAYHATKGWRSA